MSTDCPAGHVCEGDEYRCTACSMRWAVGHDRPPCPREPVGDRGSRSYRTFRQPANGHVRPIRNRALHHGYGGPGR